MAQRWKTFRGSRLLLPLLLLALVSLAGCYQSQGELTIDEEAKLTGSLSVTSPALTGAPAGELPPGVTATFAENTLTYTFEDAESSSLASLSLNGSARSNLAEVAVGSSSLTLTVRPGELPAATTEGATVNWELDFPGEILKAPEEASVEGTTVILSGAVGDLPETFSVEAVLPGGQEPPPVAEQVSYPLQGEPRNVIPLLFFGVLIAAGLVAIALGHTMRFGRIKTPKAKKKS